MMNTTQGRLVRFGVLVSMVLYLAGATPGIAAETEYTHNLRESSCTVSGLYQAALGYSCIAGGGGSLAQGNGAFAGGANSQALGYQAEATGHASHSQGNSTLASGSEAHAEGHSTTASGDRSHSQGYATEAAAPHSHAGGTYSEVLSSHTNALIHAAGSSGAEKETEFADTAHFDRLHTFEAANASSNSVLARWENDDRYAPTQTDAVFYAAVYLVEAQGDISMGSFTNGAPD